MDQNGRYHRQELLPQIGPAGQQKLRQARVLLVGCGALGSIIAEQLVRGGIGLLRIADRDVVELSNLQRQVLFDEADAHEQVPKAIAAAERLRQINSDVQVDPHVVDVHAGNLERLAGLGGSGEAVHLILDGTDNVETRFLLNDVSVKHKIPWVYGACVGSEGRCMAIRPPLTPCLRCIFPQPPLGQELATCDTAGVLGAAAAVVASLQVACALKLLVGAEVSPHLIKLDLWQDQFRAIALKDGKRTDCPTCGRGQFEFLNRTSPQQSAVLCGRNAVQIGAMSADGQCDLDSLAQKLRRVGAVQRTPYLLRCALNEGRQIALTVFPDGRAIVHGTADTQRARSLYARYIGT